MKMYYLEIGNSIYKELLSVKITEIKCKDINYNTVESVLRLALNSVSIGSLESVVHIISECTVALGGS